MSLCDAKDFSKLRENGCIFLEDGMLKRKYEAKRKWRVRKLLQ